MVSGLRIDLRGEDKVSIVKERQENGGWLFVVSLRCCIAIHHLGPREMVLYTPSREMATAMSRPFSSHLQQNFHVSSVGSIPSSAQRVRSHLLALAWLPASRKRLGSLRGSSGLGTGLFLSSLSLRDLSGSCRWFRRPVSGQIGYLSGPELTFVNATNPNPTNPTLVVSPGGASKWQDRGRLSHTRASTRDNYM